MKSGIEQYSVRFHNRAREIFFSLCNDFKHTVAGIDRQGDENVFRQLQAKYTNELKGRLQAVAWEILEQLPAGSDRNGLNRSLGSFVEDYTSEFVQKARSL